MTVVLLNLGCVCVHIYIYIYIYIYTYIYIYKTTNAKNAFITLLIISLTEIVGDNPLLIIVL